MTPTRILMVETSSARFREELRALAAPLGEITVVSSVAAALNLLDKTAPRALVVGGMPLGEPELELVTLAATRRLLPTFVCTAPADEGAALRAGASEVLSRNQRGLGLLLDYLLALGDGPTRSESARRQHQTREPPAVPLCPAGPPSTPPPARSNQTARRRPCHVIALGASTGGTDAIAQLLSQLPATLPGMVIVQHMPGSHTGAFAKRLDSLTPLQVREARDGDRVEPGVVLVAPGGFHARLLFGSHAFTVAISDEVPRPRHMPSVDVLFESVAREAGSGALGVILTGMGDDGAAGLLAMRHAGAHTLAQDEASCAVFGMPRRAIELGGVVEVAGLTELPTLIADHCAGLVPAARLAR